MTCVMLKCEEMSLRRLIATGFQVLGKVWKLADTDCDGMLDSEEFALAMHLIKVEINTTFLHFLQAFLLCQLVLLTFLCH